MKIGKIVFMPLCKVWQSPHQFSQNLQLLNSFMLEFTVLNLTQIGQEIWKVCVEMDLLSLIWFLWQLFVMNPCSAFYENLTDGLVVVAMSLMGGPASHIRLYSDLKIVARKKSKVRWKRDTFDYEAVCMQAMWWQCSLGQPRGIKMSCSKICMMNMLTQLAVHVFYGL